jgi:hypothetical protein
LLQSASSIYFYNLLLALVADGLTSVTKLLAISQDERAAQRELQRSPHGSAVMLQALTDPQWLTRECPLLEVPTSITDADHGTAAATAGAAAAGSYSSTSSEQFRAAADCSHTYTLSGIGDGTTTGSSSTALMDAMCDDFTADSGDDDMSKLYAHTSQNC